MNKINKKSLKRDFSTFIIITRQAMFPYNLCIAKILTIIHRSPGEAEMSAKAEERESSNC